MELSHIGYFSKTHGIKGQLILKVETDFFQEEVKALFIETSTGQAPYFVSELKESNNGVIVLLEDIDAIEKAKVLVGKKVFIDSKLIDEAELDFNWLGYQLIDKQFGDLGEIMKVSDNGHQLLLTVMYKNKEVILPLVDDFIETIDEAGKKLYFNAPEGLIAVYLDEEE